MGKCSVISVEFWLDYGHGCDILAGVFVPEYEISEVSGFVNVEEDENSSDESDESNESDESYRCGRDAAEIEFDVNEYDENIVDDVHEIIAIVTLEYGGEWLGDRDEHYKKNLYFE